MHWLSWWWARRFFEFANDKKEEKNLNIETLGTSMFMACFEFDQLDAGQVYVRAMAVVDQVGVPCCACVNQLALICALLWIWANRTGGIRGLAMMDRHRTSRRSRTW